MEATRDISESMHAQMQPMLTQIWKAFSNWIIWGSLQRCFATNISVIKDDCCVVAYGCFFLPEHLQCEWGGGDRKYVQHSLHCWCCDYSCLNAFLRWHYPHFLFPLNKCVHSDAQFYKTNGCWWLFELNSAKVRNCKCSLSVRNINYVST